MLDTTVRTVTQCSASDRNCTCLETSALQLVGSCDAKSMRTKKRVSKWKSGMSVSSGGMSVNSLLGVPNQVKRNGLT